MVKPSQLYRIAWGFYLVLAVAGAVWAGWGRAIPLELFVSEASWVADLGLGVAAGLLLLGVWMILRHSLHRARELEKRIGELLGPLEPVEALALAVISGFAEELFFRGAMQSAWGWIVATAVFTLLHSGPEAAFRVWTLFAAIAGLVLAALMLWRGNLLAPVTAHVLVNAVNLHRLSRASAKRASEEARGAAD